MAATLLAASSSISKRQAELPRSSRGAARARKRGGRWETAVPGGPKHRGRFQGKRTEPSARPCCWHKAIQSLWTVSRAFRKISRVDNERETLIKEENFLILSTPDCSFTVTSNWPDYRLMKTTVWIFSLSLARPGTEHTEQDLGFHMGPWFTQKAIFLLFKILNIVLLGWISSFLWLSPSSSREH